MKSTWPMLLVIGLLGLLPGPARAQDQRPSKDDSLQGLLEDLEKTPDAPRAPATDKPAPAGRPRDGSAAPRPQEPRRPGSGAGKPKAQGEALSGGDQELDSLLEKLGESKDQPQAEENRGGGPGQPGQGAKGQADAPQKKDALRQEDKPIDERLEELTGRRRKRPVADPPARGAVGEMIKQMREVEKRLSQPDTGEATRSREKQIVKKIDEMIAQARRGGGMPGRMVTRWVRRPGGQQGQQQGNEPGAQARGAGPMKPAKPVATHVKAGGKDVWGHLPPELRQVMENTFKESDLPAKAEIISRYFLSVGKGRLIRED